ncbi:MAG: PepSY domain-containing protein [Colwellia sp.]
MKSLTIKKLYKLHSWVGIITGILLFIIAFTGAVAVFARPELIIWANDEIRGPVSTTSQQLEKTIQKYADKVGANYLEEVHIKLPSARTSAIARVIYEGHFENEKGRKEHKGQVFELEPNTLSLINQSSMTEFFNNPKLDIATFLAHFHADLHLGRPIGLILTGLLGLTLMVSIATGLFVHRKILAQLFTFRVNKSFSLALNDGHKVMSVWAVLFHSTIAFTGAFLGLATVILVPAAAYVSFNGDQEKLIETFTAVKAPIIANVQQPTQLSIILEKSIKERPDLTFTNMSIMGYNDQNALVYVFGSGGEQLGGETLIYKGATAEFMNSQAKFGRLEGVTGKILDAMFPLHFGNFGGVLIKAMWAILGLATALLPITGMMLWIERGLTAKNSAHSKRTYHTFNKLLIGSCGGIVLATAVLFPAQLLLNKFMASTDHTSIIFYIFFISWLVSSVLPFVMKTKQATKVILLSTVWCLLLTMPMDIVMTGSHLFTVFSSHHYVSVSVDIVLFIIGALLFVVYQKSTSKMTAKIATAENNITLNEGV